MPTAVGPFPIFIWEVIYQARAEPVPAKEDIPRYGWARLPLSEPVRTIQSKFLNTASQAAFFWSESQQFPETVTESRWHQPWSEPSVKAKPWLTAAQQHFLEFDTVPFVKIDWFNTLSEPVRVKPNIGEGRQQSLALPETNPLQVWYPHDSWPDFAPRAKGAAEFQPTTFGYPPDQVWFPPNSFDDFAARKLPSTSLITDPSAFVQTVSQPAAPDLPTSFVGEYGPVFTQTIIYQQNAFVQLTSAPLQVWYPVDRWPDFAAKAKPSAEYQASTFTAIPPSASVLQDWPDFANKLTLAAAQQQSFGFDPVPITGSVPTVDGWGSQLSTPVRAKPAVAWQQYLAQDEASPFTESVSEDKWHQPWPDLLKVKASLAAHLQQYLAIDPAVFVASPDGWVAQFSEPVRQKAGLAAYLQQAVAFDPASFPNTAATVDGWGSQLSEPIVKGKIGLNAAQQQALAEVLVPSLVTPFLSLAWHIQLAEPVRQRPTLGAGLNPDQAEVINPASITPFIGMGWYLPLSDNGRRAPQFSAMLPIDASFNPNPIPNPPVFGVFAVSGGDVNDRFPVNGLSYTYSPMSHRTN